MKKILIFLLLFPAILMKAENGNPTVSAALLFNGKTSFGGAMLLPDVLSINQIFLINSEVEVELIFFEVTKISKGVNPVMYKNTGAEFDKYLKRMFANAVSEDRFYIDNITVKTKKNGEINVINSLVISVL